MNPRNLFFAVTSAIVMSAALLMSQGLTDGVKVTLPYPVTVGDVVLEPGEYEIRRPSSTNDQILRFYSNDKMRYQTVVQTIPAEGKEPPKESKVLLHHIGNNYYFDKIWMEDKTYGYEFVLPDRVRALQRELAVSVPATYQSAQSQSDSSAAAPVQPVDSNPPATAAVQSERSPADRIGAQNTQDRDIPPSESLVQSQASSTRESSSVSEIAQSQSNAERDTAVVRQEQRDNANAAGVDSRQDTTAARESISQRAENSELPATASGWLAYVLAGSFLILMAGFLWGYRAQE